MNFYTKILLFIFLIISFDIESQENRLEKIRVSDGLSGQIINDIAQDEMGYLWLATNKGFSTFDGADFTHYKNEKATTIFIKNNIIYIGLKSGLLIKKNNQTSFFESKEILKIKTINEKIIIVSIAGIYEFREDYLVPLQLHTKIALSVVNDIIFYNNEIYIAAKNGLWVIDELFKPSKADKILDANFVSLLITDDKLIAATSKNELKIIYQKKVTTTLKTEEKITAIKKNNNQLWVSTNGNGIDIFNLNDFSFNRKINKYNAPISNQINTIFKDLQNTVWIASKEGLYNYKSKSSLLNNFNSKLKPVIYLENIAINYTDLDGINYQLFHKTLQLSATDNNISFRYKTIDLNQPKSIQYRYKLKDVFSPWSSENTVEFANLEAGNYNFTVQSKKGLVVSDKKSFSFFIDIPLYKKPWFLILSFAISLFIASAFIDVYIKKIKKKNNQKVTQLKRKNHLLTLEQKALQLQMNPHFIFNILNGIKALANSGSTTELNTIISQFSVLLRNVLNNSRLQEISLKEELKSLKNYLDLEQNMNAINFEYKIETSLNSIDSEEILIPPMLLQPFVENSIKHAFLPNTKEAKIQLFFQVNGNFLHFTIEDNGIGFQQSKKEKANTNHESIALKVSKERIQYLSKYNSFFIEEIKDKSEVSGTKIKFKIPLKTDY
jgi:two-component system sensor histidine kinase LytS